MSESLQHRLRLEELLIDRATVGLTRDELAELQALTALLDVPVDDSYDLTAAAVDGAVAAESQIPLPENLADRLIQSARSILSTAVIETSPDSDPDVFDDQSQSSFEWKFTSPASPSANSAGASVERPGSSSPDHPLSRSGAGGGEIPGRWRVRDSIWAGGLATSLMLMVYLASGGPAATSPTGSETRTTADLRAEFLSQPPPDLVEVNWIVPDDDLSQVNGTVVWSDDRQEGYMTFRGLPANDPEVEQYQLWIFDQSRSEAYPVDGGVFDIRSNEEESIVRIDPKLKVHEATLFAVTIEQPGGVVVSDRSRLPVLSPVERTN